MSNIGIKCLKSWSKQDVQQIPTNAIAGLTPEQIKKINPDLNIEILTFKSTGDLYQESTFSKLGITTNL